jgi:hypothetical protein
MIMISGFTLLTFLQTITNDEKATCITVSVVAAVLGFLCLAAAALALGLVFGLGLGLNNNYNNNISNDTNYSSTATTTIEQPTTPPVDNNGINRANLCR